MGDYLINKYGHKMYLFKINKMIQLKSVIHVIIVLNYRFLIYNLLLFRLVIKVECVGVFYNVVLLFSCGSCCCAAMVH